jgi:hypothetical protein
VYDEADIASTDYDKEVSSFKVILNVDGQDILEVNERSIEEFGMCRNTSGSGRIVYNKGMISGTLITSWIIVMLLM